MKTTNAYQLQNTRETTLQSPFVVDKLSTEKCSQNVMMVREARVSLRKDLAFCIVCDSVVDSSAKPHQY